MDTFRLTKIFETGITDNPLDEILALAAEIHPDVNRDLIKKTHSYIIRVYIGDNPDFKASNTEYHNLRHTCSVVLAAARIFHGLTINKLKFSPEIIEQGLISSYFHDTGLLLKSHDSTELGARYTKDHEQRSIRFLHDYLTETGVHTSFAKTCAGIIDCTSLDNDVSQIHFQSAEHQMAGWVVGSADIIGQMADRYYLEQLPMLYRERRIGGVNSHRSVAELMQETTEFYNKAVINRLEVSFQDVASVMQLHFKARWDIDRDLYKENISKNIDYLSKILAECQSELQCIRMYLRRTQPPFKLITEPSASSQ